MNGKYTSHGHQFCFYHCSSHWEVEDIKVQIVLEAKTFASNGVQYIWSSSQYNEMFYIYSLDVSLGTEQKIIDA